MPPSWPTRDREAGSSDGFILIAVLWILSATAALVAIYALYIRQTAAAFPIHDHRLQAEALAEAGVELTAYQLTANRSQPARGTLKFRLHGAEVSVAFQSENGRIDLNAGPEDVLRGLFASLGANQRQADEFAKRIVTWRTAPNPQAQNGDSDRDNAGEHHGPFQNVNELVAVLGRPSEILYRALPYLTVYNGQPEINLLAAAPQVLAALPGMGPAQLNDFIGRRGSAPLDVLMARLGTTAHYVTVLPSDANHLTVSITFDTDGSRFDYDVVIFLLHNNDEPYRVLSWHDRNEMSEASVR